MPAVPNPAVLDCALYRDMWPPLATLLAAFLRFVAKGVLFPKRFFPFVFSSLKIDYANSLSLSGVSKPGAQRENQDKLSKFIFMSSSFIDYSFICSKKTPLRLPFGEVSLAGGVLGGYCILLSRLTWGLPFPFPRGSLNLFYRLKLQFVGLVTGLKTHDNAEWFFLSIWPMINIRRWRALGELFQLFLVTLTDLYDSLGVSLLHEYYVKITPADMARHRRSVSM
jgi:hypothetical protein